jgi:ribosomal protein S16
MSSMMGLRNGCGLSGLASWMGLGVLKAAVPATQRDMVRLRLQRFGTKHLPYYRIVAADVRSPRDGKCLEYLGTYNPIANAQGEKLITLNVQVLNL